MDKLKVTCTNIKNSHKKLYETKFYKKGSLQKILDFLKSNDTIPGTSVTVISTQYREEDGIHCIEKITTCPLPNNTIVNSFIGNTPVHVKYEIVYSSEKKMMVFTSRNPDILDSVFRFDEILTIYEDKDMLEFHREAKVLNKGTLIPLIGSSYEEYTTFFNFSVLQYYWEVSEKAM